VREVLIDLDDDAHRIAWTIVDGPYTHHNGSAQVFSEDERPCAIRLDHRPAPRRARRAHRHAHGGGDAHRQGDAGGESGARLRLARRPAARSDRRRG
jgi:hypothetical protein